MKRIYPACQNGSMIPFVTSTGYLLPCCQSYAIGSGQNEQFFLRESFNLNYHSYDDIVNGKEWQDYIDAFTYSTQKLCRNKCGGDQAIRTSPFQMKFDKDVKYVPIKVKTTDIKGIQFETTDRCNLKCPFCARINVAKRGQAHLLNKNDLSPAVVEDVILARDWDFILDCGTHGDSVFYKHYHEMLEIMSRSTVDVFRICIAATGKTQKWWDETHLLWNLLVRGGMCLVIFWGIDGLEDTSSIHRIGQDWSEITDQMCRAQAYGAQCQWQFIPFIHNEHQIEEAQELARHWKVNFILKPSDRFGDNRLNMAPSDPDLYYHLDPVDGKALNTPKQII